MERFKGEIVYYESNVYKKIIERHDCRNCAIIDVCSRIYYDPRDIKQEVFGQCKDDEIWKDLIQK